MARYILIDNNSGYIWGDSADFDGRIFSGDALEYAKALDESIGTFDREYEMLRRAPDGASGYHVYRADINGSEAVSVVHDGQSRDEIAAVEQGCELVGFVEYKDRT